MLRHCGFEQTDDEDLFDPRILNRRLIDCGAFTPAADLELSFIGRLYPLEYLGAAPYSRAALEQAARDASPCLVTVPGVKAALHFTALLERLPDDALVFDPVRGATELRAYERICGLRVFRRTEAAASAGGFRKPSYKEP